MRPVNIGLIGAGTIGRGVVEAITQNGKLISARTGVELVLRSICDIDEKALSGVPCADNVKRTGDASEVLNDTEIDVVVELIGGVHPATELILDAMRRGKHVVTANKAVLSEHWQDIFRTAADNKVAVGFEASVGGGIPIIRAMRESFVSNKLHLIYGILNGTSNFILTMMSEEGRSFEEALKVAQEKGIAESDPELDVSGRDSAHKLAILALLGFGINVSPADIYTEGIENISTLDIQYARAWGYSIKLLAIAKKEETGLELRVHPVLLPSWHLLANVKGEDNAIFVRGDFVGESLLYGKGAGRRPTASSVIADIVEIGKYIALPDKTAFVPYNPLYAPGSVEVMDEKDIALSFYMRFSVIDKPGVLAKISSVLAEHDISIASLSQEERKEGESVPVTMLTHKVREGDMRDAIGRIDKMEFVTDKTAVIRMES